jgi:hypothetical protein
MSLIPFAELFAGCGQARMQANYWSCQILPIFQWAVPPAISYGVVQDKVSESLIVL